MNEDIAPEYKNKIIRVMNALFPEAKIYLYGSRARGDHSSRSDIDIAVDMGRKLEPVVIMEARDMFTESTIPYRIDVVDVHSISSVMKSL